MSDFHETRFPVDIALGARGGPERRTDLALLGSGREVRNARWAHSRRRYDAGFGVKTLAAIEQALAFFEERRGRLHGFRWRDRLDWKSCPLAGVPSPEDQALGLGDGETAAFALVKIYGRDFAPYRRRIEKPVAGTVRVAVDGDEKIAGVHFDCDAATGVVLFRPAFIPPPGALVSAGYAFDVPVRFDADRLDIDLAGFDAGDIPHIPVIEIIP